MLCCPKADDWPNAEGEVPKAEGRPNADACVPAAKGDVGDEENPNTLGLLTNAAKPPLLLGLAVALDDANALAVVGVPKADELGWLKDDCPTTEPAGAGPNVLGDELAPKPDAEAPNVEVDVAGGFGVCGDAS